MLQWPVDRGGSPCGRRALTVAGAARVGLVALRSGSPIPVYPMPIENDGTGTNVGGNDNEKFMWVGRVNGVLADTKVGAKKLKLTAGADYFSTEDKGTFTGRREGVSFDTQLVYGPGELQAEWLQGGRDPETNTPYTGVAGTNPTWRFTHDAYGNLATVTDPTSFELHYTYDPTVHGHRVALEDSFGLRSSARHDLRLGVVTETTDIRRYFEDALLTRRPRSAPIRSQHVAVLSDDVVLVTCACCGASWLAVHDELERILVGPED